MLMLKICPRMTGPTWTDFEMVTSLDVVMVILPAEITIEPTVRPVNVTVTTVLALTTILVVVITIRVAVGAATVPVKPAGVTKPMEGVGMAAKNPVG